MKIITEITPQVKNPKRCSIFLDGEFFCGMALETVMKNRLKVGMSVTKEELEQIQHDSERTAALDKAMTFLSGSVKTEKQTRDYLKDKGYTYAVINYVADKLKENGLLNDGYYAKRFAERLIFRGVNATVRRRLGADVNAACGQLRRLRKKDTEK